MVKEKTHFTCIGRRHGAPAIPANKEDWEKMRNEPWLADMCKRILAGDESLKAKLPIWTPSCAEFKNNHRAIADALKPLQRLMLDFDEKGHSEEIKKKALELQEQGKWEILLVEESVRKGTHVLITLPVGMTPQEAQERFSKDVGFMADPALKDIARCIYMVPAANTLYVSERLFSPQSISPLSVIQSEAKNLGNIKEDEHADAPEIIRAKPSSTRLRHSVPLDDKTEDDNINKENNPCQSVKSVVQGYPETYDGIPYTQIVETLEEQMGGRPEHGSRNNFIFSMACHLRYICDDDPDWIAQVLPTYGEGREKWMNSIRSACARSQTQAMPRIMKRTIRIAKGNENESEIINQNSEIPEMPKKLPPLIELLVSRTPDIYKPAVAHAVFPSLAAHLWKVKFRYIDNVPHEATLMNVLMAGTGAGKDCISEPINRIMADIRQRDEENLQREREWKKEINSKGANKDKRQRPEGLVIQEIDADMTNPAFVMRTAEADGHFLYTKLNEIDQFDALRGSGKGGQQFQIMCLAFDPGNRYGQTRVGAQSVTEKVTIRFNWNAATTIQKGQRYFRSVLTDGPISRINFCTIPEREIGADMPVYGTYDEVFDEELQPYIERLCGARGEIFCQEAFDLAKVLKDENAEFARLSQSRVYENLSFRANVIAYLKACVLYVAHGDVWDKTMEDFVRWSLQYDLWCKMEFFGEAIGEAQTETGTGGKKRGPQNLLDLLPDIFTREQAQHIRQRQGFRGGNVQDMLKNWRKRGYIVLTEDSKQEDLSQQKFVKTEKYLSNHRSVGQ